MSLLARTSSPTGGSRSEQGPYEQDDLAREVDTLIRRAEELLGDFPQDKVRYRPEEYERSR